MATLAGQSVGKYKLLERRGRGGMAEVYKAHHPKLDRTVAVKILHGYLAEGPDFLGRFEREAKAVANLRHPHIVQIHDFDVDNDTYYMVMEYIAGGTLQDLMDAARDKGGYIPTGQVLAIMRQVASALDYAHGKGIIHRDIKPSNILLDENGEAFLADFGIARMVSTTQFTSTGALIGTPTYMSPEQSKGMELTPVSDIYSLGIILYELLTGQAPFAGDTPLGIIQKHISEPLPLPSKLRPALPASLEAVVIKALAKEPSERYQSAGELYRTLEQATPPDLIADLDPGVKKKKVSRAAQPTELMDRSSLQEAGHPSTVAMGRETLADITEKSLEASQEASISSPPVSEASPILSTQEKKFKPAGFWGRLRSRPIIIVGIAVILVTVVALVLAGLLGGTSCSNIDACMILATELRNQGDLQGSLSAMDKALSMVIPEGHRDFAWVWCERAALLEQMGRLDEAVGSRNTCDAWQRGE